MATPRNRNPESSAGDWYVDTRCINCGASRHVAPELIVESRGLSVFARQPEGAAEVHQAWLAAEVCPTRSVGAPQGEHSPPGLYPHAIEPNVLLCGHNARSSYGAHSWLVIRPSGNLLVDSPRYTNKLAEPFDERGGISAILLTHRDDVADAAKWADRYQAAVYIHADDADAAPYATELIAGLDASEILPDVVAIPVPGHTKGSVVYRVGTALFTGDSLYWNTDTNDLDAFEHACWYSWSAQKESLARLGQYDFERVFAGHGAWSPRLERAEMRERLMGLVARM